MALLVLYIVGKVEILIEHLKIDFNDIQSNLNEWKSGTFSTHFIFYYKKRKMLHKPKKKFVVFMERML